MNKGTAIVGFLLCFLAGMGLMYSIDRANGVEMAAEDSAGGGEAAPGAHANAKIPVTSEDPTWGNANAPVTIVEFSDFQCPFCGRAEGSMKQVKETYGPDKVRVVWKHNPLPFHKQATPAHIASQIVFELGGNDAFWKFHEKAFANMKNLDPSNFPQWAKEAGVDEAKFKKEFDSNQAKYKAMVDKTLAQGREVGVRGTPNFRINGVEVSGAQPFSKFKEVIDAQLKEAQQLVASGVKPEEVYPKLVAKNAKAAPKAPERREPAEDDKTVWKVDIAKDDPVRGPKDAAVTIVMWSDYQCPFCKRVEPTLDKIRETYKDDVRIVWKDNALPFHPRAKPAATLAWVAYEQGGDELFWKAHDEIFSTGGKLSDQELEQVAKNIGVPWAKVKAAIDSKKYDKRIGESMAQAAKVKARGTPHFFINGRRVSGAQPFEKFKTVIDEEIKKAKAMVAKGTPKAKVYDEIMKGGKVPPPPPPPEKKDVPAPTADLPFKGGKNAKIVIQEFSDFQCPFCSRVLPTLKQVVDEYGDEVKIVWRDMPLPFHKDAPLASEAALEAFEQKGNDGFWKFHDALFAAQKQPDGLKRENLEKIAQQQGLDMAKFKAALDSRKHKAKVDKNVEIANKAGIRGTPGFTVNGYFISGAQPFEKFKEMIELAKKDLKKK